MEKKISILLSKITRMTLSLLLKRSNKNKIANKVEVVNDGAEESIFFMERESSMAAILKICRNLYFSILRCRKWMG